MLKIPHVKIPPASTVKLLTAMVVLDHLPLHKKVKISRMLKRPPSVGPFLREGEVYTVEDLLNLMLIKSSNQAAVALAEAVSGTEENFSVL
jgi:D-alanyl-D-alanine carboxypeptidase